MFGKPDKQTQVRNAGVQLLNAITDNANNIVKEAMDSHDVNYMLEIQKTLDNLVYSVSKAKQKLDIHLECLNKETSA